MRHQDRASARMLLRESLVVPPQGPMGAEPNHAERHMDERAAVRRAGFDQADGDSRVGAQPIGEHAARRARAHNEVVEFVATAFHRTLLTPVAIAGKSLVGLREIRNGRACHVVKRSAERGIFG